MVLQIKSLGQFGLTMETARNTFWFWLASSGNISKHIETKRSQRDKSRKSSLLWAEHFQVAVSGSESGRTACKNVMKKLAATSVRDRIEVT